MATKKNQSKPGLYEFLVRKLAGSSLTPVTISEQEIHLDAFDMISVRIKLDSAKKKLQYELFSPKLNRTIGVEQVGGMEFMEAGLEEELEKENHRVAQDDTLLALDLIRKWAAQEEYGVTLYVNPKTGQHMGPPKKRGPKPKK
ncbi:MAG: hypothetical protein JRN20_23065 [Nitrososphaerota archaeon]|nr:hypothetical protein [Nitrososphaerota archaeon]